MPTKHYLLERYDMHSDIDTMHHLAISDADGRTVVVEYINNEMFVADAHIVTNFFLTPGDRYGFGSEYSKERYNTLQGIYDTNNGVLDETGVKNALEAVSSGKGFEPEWKSQWSVVYNQASGDVTYYRLEDFNNKYSFNIINGN